MVKTAIFFCYPVLYPWCLFYTLPLHHHPHPQYKHKSHKPDIWCNILLTYKHSWPITCSQLRVDCKTWHASGLLVMSFAIWFTVHILIVTVLTDNIQVSTESFFQLANHVVIRTRPNLDFWQYLSLDNNTRNSTTLRPSFHPFLATDFGNSKSTGVLIPIASSSFLHKSVI